MDFPNLTNLGTAIGGAVGAGLTLLGTKITAKVKRESTLYQRLERVENRLDDCEQHHRECKEKLAALGLP